MRTCAPRHGGQILLSRSAVVRLCGSSSEPTAAALEPMSGSERVRSCRCSDAHASRGLWSRARGEGLLGSAGDARLGPDIRSVAVSNTSTHHIPRPLHDRTGAARRPARGLDRHAAPRHRRPAARPAAHPRRRLGAAPTSRPASTAQAKTGVLVRLGKGSHAVVARFVQGDDFRGTAVTFSVPRRALGFRTWFVFEMAAAREWNDEGAVPPRAKPDLVPADGTFRYTLTADGDPGRGTARPRRAAHGSLVEHDSPKAEMAAADPLSRRVVVRLVAHRTSRQPRASPSEP